MADKKISQLTGSTVPLAGTEELPVVQGGVTKKVTVANLTSGRDVAMSTLSVGGSAISGVSATLGNNTGAPVKWGLVSLENCGGIAPPSSAGLMVGWNYSNGGGETNLVYGTGLGGAPALAIASYDGVSLSEACRFTAAGNMAFPSGKGIDFSATAGAGTSELFDDYEEGTWTPVLSDGTNNATMSANSAGSYTKIGRLIVLNASVETTSLGSVTGAIRITGLPYSNLTGIPFYASGVAGYGELLNITAGQSVGLAINSGNSHINLNLWDAAGGITPMQASEWSADGVITFSISYFGA